MAKLLQQFKPGSIGRLDLLDHGKPGGVYRLLATAPSAPFPLDSRPAFQDTREPMDPSLRLVSQKQVYKGRMLEVTVDRVELPNHREVDLEIIRHPGAAAVVPVDAQGRVVLVRQVRYATGGWLVEIPAGKLGGDEAPEACAARELAEEAGLAAGKLTPMGCIWTTPGFTDERIWLFLATELTEVRQALEADEVLTIQRMPLAEAIEKAQRGEIDDAKSVCALLRVPRFLRQ